MRFHSRNYLLYLLTVGVLIVGIVTTVVNNQGKQSASLIETLNNSQPEATTSYPAEVISNNVLDKNAQLAMMREKVKESEPIKIVADNNKETKTTIVTKPEEISRAEEPKPENELKKCPWYKVYGEVWNKGQVTFSVIEGARILTKKPDSILTASTTNNIILQLPLLAIPPKVPTCLPSDVIGVALDGSLIRNSEKNLYSIFGGETLLGYNLDGFPLYGKNDQLELDKCGGTTVNGQYQYYLQTKGENIINCFAGSPISL